MPLTSQGDGETRQTDEELLEGLLQRDEAAFRRLVDRYHAPLIAFAIGFVDDREAATDVVQEAWVGVLTGLHRFEGRSSLRTWIFRIVANIARTRAVRDRRTITFSELPGDAEGDEPAVEVQRFLANGHWASVPDNWEAIPETQLLAKETRERVATAIALLPPAQQTVIRLRDLEGWTAADVCNVLEVTETNQRVLLHRARSKVRKSLEDYFSG